MLAAGDEADFKGTGTGSRLAQSLHFTSDSVAGAYHTHTTALRESAERGMGGNLSSLGSSAGGIHVGTSRSGYSCGDRVDGKVYLHVTKELQCDGVRLQLKGVASALWKEQHQNDGDWETLIFQGHDELLHLEVPLMSPCTLEPGQYEFAFELALPAVLPGTLHKAVDDARADVTYTLEATCVTKGFFSRNFVSSQEVVVFANVAPLVTAAGMPAGGLQNVQCERREDVNCCCCFNKGFTEAKTTVGTDLVHPGDSVPMMVSVDNTNSTVPIRSVVFQLEQMVTLRGRLRNVCSGGYHNYRLQSSSHFVSAQDSGYDYANCSRHHHGRYSRFRTHEKRFTMVLSKVEAQQGCDAGALLSNHQQALFVPSDALTTTQTNTVSCSHGVAVTLQTGMCMTNLRMATPVTVAPLHQHVHSPFQQQILMAQQAEPSAPMMPNGIVWEPIKSEPVMVAVPEPSAPPMPMAMNDNHQFQQPARAHAHYPQQYPPQQYPPQQYPPQQYPPQQYQAPPMVPQQQEQQPLYSQPQYNQNQQNQHPVQYQQF